MSAFTLDSLGTGGEPMTLGSPTSPKPGGGAQFLPGFLMGDIPTPVTPQLRPSLGIMELRSPMMGGSSPHPVLPAHKEKSGAPPVASLYDDLGSPRKLLKLSTMQTSHTGMIPSTPCTPVREYSPAINMQTRKGALSPAQVDPFYTQGDSLTSDDVLDDSWITVFGFPQASASYILMQFLQYGNIVKHVMSNAGNWMHIQYQSKLQARKALSKDGKIFGDCIMIGVKPCIDKSVMDSGKKTSVSSVCTPPVTAFGTPTQQTGTPRSGMRPLAAAYRVSTSDYQVLSDKQTPKKDDSLVSKAMEFVFGW